MVEIAQGETAFLELRASITILESEAKIIYLQLASHASLRAISIAKALAITGEQGSSLLDDHLIILPLSLRATQAIETSKLFRAASQLILIQPAGGGVQEGETTAAKIGLESKIEE